MASESGSGAPGAGRRGRRALSAKAGILILAATVIVVGVAGYVVISHAVDAGTSSHTVESCQPSAVPPCADAAPAGAASPSAAATAAPDAA